MSKLTMQAQSERELRGTTVRRGMMRCGPNPTRLWAGQKGIKA